jgi:sigma-B regulation protein RsbU (phosphoserine phosphatase)
MRTSGLFRKTLVLVMALFAVIAGATSILSGWTLYRSLIGEYRSKGVAIARSVADSSVEILLNRGLATVQTIIDQFAEIDGVAYVFVADAQGDVVAHTFVPAVPREALALVQRSRAGPSTGDVVTTTLQLHGHGDFIHVYAPILAGVAGYVHVGMDQGVIRAQIWSTVARQQALVLAIFLLSVVVAYLLVNRIARPLSQLAEYTRSLATHDFAAGLDIPAEIQALPERSQDEVGRLAASFMDMEHRLHRYLQDLAATTAAKERIESELKIAHEIQMNMVPKTFPAFPDRREFDIHAALVPAREVGGDFYDFFFVDGQRLCFAIGDVSGKGVPAALFMALTKSVFRATGGRHDATAVGILSELNGEICQGNDTCMFATVFCCILDARSGQVEYSNAGHMLPYVLSSGTVTALPRTGGTALGVTTAGRVGAGQLLLRPGDRLVLYTDGVTDAVDESGRLFSEARLREALLGARGPRSEDVIEHVLGEVRRFSAGAPQADDITLVVLGYAGPQEEPGGGWTSRAPG